MLKDIFITFFKIGCFTLGGGYAMIPVIQEEVVENKKWISQEEFLDGIAITNSLPGPLSTNTATYIGYRLAGPLGSLTAVLATSLPAFFIILIIAAFFTNIRNSLLMQKFFDGVRPAIVVLILFAVINLSKFLGFKKINVIIALTTLIAVVFFNIHPFFAIIISGLIGIFFLRKKEKKK